MTKKISYREYKRRVFNEALLECFSKIHLMTLTENCNNEDCATVEMASKMAKEFFKKDLCLDSCTITDTKKKLDGSATFIKDCIAVCESIAEIKSVGAATEKLDLDDSQKIELSEEDKNVIDTVFEAKSPDLQVDTVRDAVVNALVAEEKKSQEIKDAVNMAQKSSDPKQLEETAARLDRGPTSLMHSIMNNFSQAAFKDVNEASGSAVLNAGSILRENADTIKTRSVMFYSLFEMSNVFAIHKYSNAEVKALAKDIYYNR